MLYLPPELPGVGDTPATGRRFSMNSETQAKLDQAIALKIDGQYDDAVTILQQVLVEQPNSSDARYQLGLVYGFTGLFDESIEELTTASKLAPASIEIQVDLALTFSMLGMYEEAKCEFEKVLVLDPTNKRALDSIKFLGESL
jgi:tetratricopeptide (TPR) repeat protein